MLDITANTDPLVERFTKMLEKIEHFKRVDIGAELSEWQVDDLHRHRPFTMRSRAKGIAATKIRPHSLFEMKRSALYQRRQGRRIVRLITKGSKQAAVVFRRFQPHVSTREILRKEMEQRLVSRMEELVREKLVW